MILKQSWGKGARAPWTLPGAATGGCKGPPPSLSGLATGHRQTDSMLNFRTPYKRFLVYQMHRGAQGLPDSYAMF